MLSMRCLFNVEIANGAFLLSPYEELHPARCHETRARFMSIVRQ